MNRRDFLKGAAVAVAMVAAPVSLIPQAQTFAPEPEGDLVEAVLKLMEEQAEADFKELCVDWKLVATDRNVRDCTDLFVYQRQRDGERQYAEIAMPWWAEATPKETQAIVEGAYP